MRRDDDAIRHAGAWALILGCLAIPLLVGTVATVVAVIQDVRGDIRI